MNSGLYDLFLQNIDRATNYINGLNEQAKVENADTIRQAIENLNNQAADYAQFIAQDTQRYDSTIDRLKQALSYDSDLANSLVPSVALIPAQDEAPADSTQEPPATPTDATQPATPAEPAAASEPNQETLNAAFAKYMGSSYDPNSPMDKGKMETVKNALKKFQEENNKPFDINDSEDLTKMRPVMNAAYQSEEYKKVAGVGTRTGAQPSATSAAAPRQQTAAQRRATAPASPKGGPTYYVRTGFNRYVPAVEADITSGQQLFMQNPNRAARMVYPYVKVDSRPVRRATPTR